MEEHVESKQTVSKPGVSETIAQSSLPLVEQAEELGALEARLEARIQDEVERRFQSAKDKRWAQLEKQYGELRELAQAKDISVEESPGEGKALVSARRLLAMAGLGVDAEALDLLRKYSGGAGGEAQLLTEVAELALRRLKREPAGAGAVIQLGGGRAAPSLRADYERALSTEVKGKAK